MSSKFECHYRQIFGGGLGQLSKSNATTARYSVGGGHTTANRGNLIQRLRCFALRIRMLRSRRPPRELPLLLQASQQLELGFEKSVNYWFTPPPYFSASVIVPIRQYSLYIAINRGFPFLLRLATRRVRHLAPRVLHLSTDAWRLQDFYQKLPSIILEM